MSQTHFLPVQRHTMVERPALLQEILRGDPALIVIRGAAGTGKSVAAAQAAAAFVTRWQSEDAPTCGPDGMAHAVWIRSERGGAREDLWRRVFRALDDAGLGGPDVTRLAEGGLADSPGTVIATALGQIPGHLLIVLDDAHRELDEDIEETLLDVLENTERLTVLITSRSTHPRLASSTAHLRLPIREVDAARLALSRAEITDLLRLRAQPAVGDSLTAAAHAIYEASRGWPLAAHALAIEHDRRLHSGEQFTRPTTFARDLVDRLLEDATPRLQEALCASALLDEVNLAALAHMLDASEADIQHLLASFEAGFGYWTDEAGVRWYRHHELIGTELRSRADTVLGPARTREIAARAAAALRHDRPRSALRAAILAQHWQLVSDILAEGSTLSIERRRTRPQLTMIPAEVRAEYPVIGAFALIEEYAYPSGHVGRMLTGLRMLAGRTLAVESGKPGLPGLTAATLRMLAARLSGNERLALAMAERVQETWQQLADDDSARYERPLQRALNQTAITLLHAERFIDADHVLEPLRAHPNNLLPATYAHALALSAWSDAWRGDIRAARQRIREAAELDVPVAWHSAYIGTGYRIAEAFVALEQGDAPGAREQLDTLAPHAATIEHWPQLVALGTLVTETEHGPLAAVEYLDEELARRRGRRATLATPERMLRSLRARLLWQGGKVLPAGKRRLRGETAAVYAALSRGENEIAAALAAHLCDDVPPAAQPRARAELLLLRGELARRAGDEQAATDHARRAGALMENNDLALPMRALPLDAARALARLAPTLPLAHSTYATVREIQPLTPAERRSLVEVVERGSVRLAAEALYLSPATVKGYLKHAYRKLGVRSRAEAIRIAADTGLLNEQLERPDDAR